MEQNNTNDLQELREQMNLLHSKLENQTIIDDRQLEQFTRTRVTSIKAVSSAWLTIALIVLLMVDGFYGLFYFTLTHFGKMMTYYEQTIGTPLNNILNGNTDDLTPEQQKRIAKLSPEQFDDMKEAQALFNEKYDSIKSLSPEELQEAADGVKDIMFGGWMLVLNILINMILITIAVIQICYICFLRRCKLYKNITSLTEQMRKVRTSHMVSCAVICLLLAMLMPLVLQFHESTPQAWRIALVTIPALLALIEFIQFTPLSRYRVVTMLDWGRLLYIRHACDKIISRMEDSHPHTATPNT
ncbi:MAG: hypothetical protein IJT12_03090 [Paludibacteraceae bacterium]|nr:hypothetical protein [Paludibacteraceae bacterium]